ARREAPRVLGDERRSLDRHEASVDTDAGRAAGGDVEVGTTLAHHERKQVFHRDHGDSARAGPSGDTSGCDSPLDVPGAQNRVPDASGRAGRRLKGCCESRVACAVDLLPRGTARGSVEELSRCGISPRVPNGAFGAGGHTGTTKHTKNTKPTAAGLLREL